MGSGKGRKTGARKPIIYQLVEKTENRKQYLKRRELAQKMRTLADALKSKNERSS